MFKGLLLTMLQFAPSLQMNSKFRLNPLSLSFINLSAQVMTFSSHPTQPKCDALDQLPETLLTQAANYLNIR